MKIFFLFLLCFYLTVSTYGQITFNHQYNFDFPFKVLTSVLPTDSCYYATKTMKAFKAGNLADTYIVPVKGWPVGTYFLQYLQGNSLLLAQPFIKQ
ncbi:MAG: hypothetical protein J5I98_13490 [Phaeodactylibacter sp.]|nr:hypothetical protein [Phaeodactylibacter sp.]